MYACIVHSLLSISKTQSKLYVRQRIWPRSPSNIVYDISINTFLSARFYEKRKRKKKKEKNLAIQLSVPACYTPFLPTLTVQTFLTILSSY